MNWISVTEKLPNNGQEIIIWVEDKEYGGFWYEAEYSECSGWIFPDGSPVNWGEVTHWMNPDPPKEN